MSAPSSRDRLIALGGHRSESAIQDDLDSAVSATHPRALERYQSFNGRAPDPSHPDVQLTARMSTSLWQSRAHAERADAASRQNDSGRATTEMQFAYGYRNEAASHQRLREDIAENGQVGLALQGEVNLGSHSRYPDAMIAHNGNPTQGVVIREMKTRSLDDRSVGQLQDFATLANPRSAPAHVQWHNAQVTVPVHRVEVEMRSSSSELSETTMGHFQDLSRRAGGNFRVRTNSMTSFEPVEVIQARRREHGVK